MEKLFVVRKYVKAKSAADAIKKEKRLPVDDVYVDDDWKRNQPLDTSKKEMGFKRQ